MINKKLNEPRRVNLCLSLLARFEASRMDRPVLPGFGFAARTPPATYAYLLARARGRGYAWLRANNLVVHLSY